MQDNNTYTENNSLLQMT